MDTQPECGVQGWKSGQKDNSPVPGIHFKVEKQLEIIQDSRTDIIRLINDDHRGFSFFNGKPCQLFLDRPEVIRLPEAGLNA